MRSTAKFFGSLKLGWRLRTPARTRHECPFAHASAAWPVVYAAFSFWGERFTTWAITELDGACHSVNFLSRKKMQIIAFCYENGTRITVRSQRVQRLLGPFRCWGCEGGQNLMVPAKGPYFGSPGILVVHTCCTVVSEHGLSSPRIASAFRVKVIESEQQNSRPQDGSVY